MLGDRFEHSIKQQLNIGRNGSASENISVVLRVMEDHYHLVDQRRTRKHQG